MNLMNKMAKQKKPTLTSKPTFKQRQGEFVKKVNKIGEELGVAITAQLDINGDGVIPKLFLVDTFKKKK